MKIFTLKQNIFLVAVVLLLSIFALSSLVFAQSPTINYQGKLTDASGVAVPDGPYEIEFKLYTVPTGGTAVWTETLSGGNEVAVQNGLFSVMLGSTTPLTGVDFTQTLYLGVKVETDLEMTPRKILGTVPAAFEARNAETLAGIATTSFVRSDQVDSISASTSASLLSIIQSGSGGILSLFDGGSEVFNVRDGGNVGIGTTTGTAKLTVVGDGYFTGAFRDSTNNAGSDGMILVSTGTGTTWLATTSLNFVDTNTQLSEEEVEDFVGGMLGGVESGISVTYQDGSNNIDFVVDNVTAAMLNAQDFGDFSCNGTICTLDQAYLTNLSGSSLFDLGDVPSVTTGDLLYASDVDTISVRNIGTTGQILQVVGGVPTWQATTSLGIKGSLFTDTGASTYLTSLTDNLGIGTTSPASKLDVWGDFRVGTSSTPTLFTDVSTNRIGIGTDSPAHELHVNGDDSSVLFGNDTVGVTSDFFYYNGNAVYPGPIVRINKAGASAKLLVTAANGDNDAVFSVGDGAQDGLWTFGFDDTDNDSFKIASGETLGTGSDYLTIATSGKIGIGTTSPSQLLSVGATEGSQFLVSTAGVVTDGTWNGDVIGDAYLTKTGAWTGTFDGQEGSYYLARANHTGTQTASTISDFSTTARGLFSSTATGLTYTSGTGVFSLDGSYNIPLNASTSDWTSFFDTPSSRITAGNAIDWSGNTLNVDITGDWTGTIDGNNFAGGAIGLGDLLYGSGAGTVSELGIGTTGQILQVVGGVPTWQATTSLGINDHDSVTLAGENYLSLSGQQITANAVDLSGSNVTGTLAGGRFPALTGDVTTSAGSLTTAIANDVINYTDILYTHTIGGNPAFGANETWFGTTGIIFEGATADNFEGLLTSSVASSDKTWTLQNVTGTIYSTGGTDVSVADGGTGASTLTQGGVLYGNGTGAITNSGVLTNGQLLIGDGTTFPTVATLTQGTGITVTNGAGSITIASTLGTDISAAEIANGDHGAFTYTGGVASLDALAVSSSTLNTSTWTNGYVLQASSTASGGLAWVATSSLGVSTAFSNSAELAALLSDEVGSGGGGFAVFNNSPTIITPTFTTSATTPLIYGGTGTGSNLTLRSTSGVGTTDYIAFGVGNDGATEAMRIINSGNVGIGTTTPASKLDVWGDFRVGTGTTPVLYVNPLNGRIGINKINPSVAFDVAGAMAVSGNLYVSSFYDADNTAYLVNPSTSGVSAALAGRVGIGTTTPSSKLTIESNSLTGSVTAGLKEQYGFTNSTLDAVYYGGNTYITNAPTATSTLVGGIIRVEDSTTLGNVVRGFEVQTNKGTNTQGENTALSGFARTFGVRGFSSGDAGGLYEPAGGFFESGGTTQGNAIRGYSSTITSASLASLFHEDSTFTGTGLLMNFGNDTGSFSGNFIDLQNAGTSKFVVNSSGSLSIGNGGFCVDTDGGCTPVAGRVSAVSYNTGNSDLAEMYFSGEDLEPGEIVYAKGGISIGRASQSSTEKIIGVVSTKPGLTLGQDDVSLRTGEAGYPVALTGRVPIKLSNENGPIKVGDKIALSSIPGVGKKAGPGDVVVGSALEDFDGDYAYSAGYINQFGDDIKLPDLENINLNDDARINDGCSFGGGGAIDESGSADCVKKEGGFNTDELDEATAEAEEALEEIQSLATVPAKRMNAENGSVSVGTILMFVKLGRFDDVRTAEVIQELLSTSTDLVLGAKNNSGETLWSRLKELAQNFVDGVLTITGLKTDIVETEQLCIEDVCVTADDLRSLLNGNGSGSGPTSPSPEPSPSSPPEPIEDEVATSTIDTEPEAEEEDGINDSETDTTVTEEEVVEEPVASSPATEPVVEVVEEPNEEPDEPSVEPEESSPSVAEAPVE
ncbi:hypothetical protein KC845_01775 [Candidatus Kaiserbacteria bacterium]|nr:hypothetical protein [Candidatus Kaiserbacteria bacterium]